VGETLEAAGGVDFCGTSRPVAPGSRPKVNKDKSRGTPPPVTFALGQIRAGASTFFYLLILILMARADCSPRTRAGVNPSNNTPRLSQARLLLAFELEDSRDQPGYYSISFVRRVCCLPTTLPRLVTLGSLPPDDSLSPYNAAIPPKTIPPILPQTLICLGYSDFVSPILVLSPWVGSVADG
jgi:hypothetical protein